MASLLVMVNAWLVWSTTLADRAKSAVSKVCRTCAGPNEPTTTMDNIEGDSANPEMPNAAAAAHDYKPVAEPAAAEAERRPSALSMWARLTSTKAVPVPRPACGNAAAPASANSSRAFAFFRRSQQATKLSVEATLGGAAENTAAAPTATAPTSAVAKLANGIKSVFTRSAPVAAAGGTIAAPGPRRARTPAFLKGWRSGSKAVAAAAAAAATTTNTNAISGSSDVAATTTGPSDNAAEPATPATDAPSCGDSTDGGCLTAATAAEATCTVVVAIAPSAASCTSSVKSSKAAAPTPRSPKDIKRLLNRMAKAASPAKATAPAPGPQGPSKLERFAIKCREGGAKALRRISSRGATNPDQRALGDGAAVPVA